MSEKHFDCVIQLCGTKSTQTKFNWMNTFYIPSASRMWLSYVLDVFCYLELELYHNHLVLIAPLLTEQNLDSLAPASKQQKTSKLIRKIIFIWPKNSLTVKKCKIARVKGAVKLKGAAKKWLWWLRLIGGKKLNNNNSCQFVLLHPRNQYKIHVNCCC